MKFSFGWLTGKSESETGEDAPNPSRRAFFMGAAALAAGGGALALGATKAEAWHKGHPHNGGGGGHYWKKSQAYNSHSNWKSQQAYDYHSPNRSAYRRRKYYHRQYGSWGGHPQCLHLGPFGVCEY